MTEQDQHPGGAVWLEVLEHPQSSVRLQAALAAGTQPDSGGVRALIERCAVEADFFVRDMLTWALTRQDASVTVPMLIDELGSVTAQARSQALHTLSKIGDRAAWPAITRSLLTDPEEEVARSAWRAAVVLVAVGEEAQLASDLASQLGRGGRELQLSLSRALVALGDAGAPAVAAATQAPDGRVRRHAVATERLRHDPDGGFELAMDEATRVAVLGPDRSRGG